MLILEEQTDGIDVASYALGKLEHPDDRHQWAHLMGGTFMLTSRYLYRHANSPHKPQRMMRHVRLPDVVNEYDEKKHPDDYEDEMFDLLEKVHDKSRNFEILYNSDKASRDRYFELAKAFGRAGAMLALFPLRLEAISGQYNVRLYTLNETQRMFDNTLHLAGELEQQPSLAQLSVPQSKLAHYILTSDKIHHNVANAYTVALEESGEKLKIK